MNNSPILLEYSQLRKAARNVQNMVMLVNGDPIPSDLTNHPWATWINEYHSRNLHLLPQETVQENFSANFLEVHSLGPMKEKSSSLFSHLEPINEEDEVLVHSEGQIIWRKLSSTGTSRYYRPGRTKWHQERSNQTFWSQHRPEWTSQMMHPCLKGHTMPPWLIPFQALLYQLFPPPSHSSIHGTNQVKHKHINCLQLGSIQENLPFKSCGPLPLRSGATSKKTMTTERLQALPAEAQACGSNTWFLLDGCESWASCGQPNTTTSDNWGYIGWHDNSHRPL